MANSRDDRYQIGVELKSTTPKKCCNIHGVIFIQIMRFMWLHHRRRAMLEFFICHNFSSGLCVCLNNFSKQIKSDPSDNSIWIHRIDSEIESLRFHGMVSSKSTCTWHTTHTPTGTCSKSCTESKIIEIYHLQMQIVIWAQWCACSDALNGLRTSMLWIWSSSRLLRSHKSYVNFTSNLHCET